MRWYRYYFGRRRRRVEGWKWSEKLTRTAYHCCRRAEGIRLPLSYYAPAADSSRFVCIIIITINFPVGQTSSNGLSPSLFLSSSLRVRLFCVAFAYIMRGLYTPPLQSTDWPYPSAWGTKKIILLLLLRQQNKREHLVNKKPDTIFKRRREALGCRRQV